MPKEKGQRAVDKTTNIRIEKELHSKLAFLTSLTGKNMSEIIEGALRYQYPSLEEDIERFEKAKRDITDKYEGGGK